MCIRDRAEDGEGVVEVGDAGAGEVIVEAVPGPFGGGAALVPAEEDDGLEAVEVEMCIRDRRRRGGGRGDVVGRLG